MDGRRNDTKPMGSDLPQAQAAMPSEGAAALDFLGLGSSVSDAISAAPRKRAAAKKKKKKKKAAAKAKTKTTRKAKASRKPAKKSRRKAKATRGRAKPARGREKIREEISPQKIAVFTLQLALQPSRLLLFVRSNKIAGG